MKLEDLQNYAREREESFRMTFLFAHRYIEAYQARHKTRHDSNYGDATDRALQLQFDSLGRQVSWLKRTEDDLVKKANRSGKKKKQCNPTS